MHCGADCDTWHEQARVPQHNTLPIRKFDPNWNELYHGRVDDLIGECRYCRLKKIKIPQTPQELTVDHNSVVIYTDGLVRDASTPNARMSMGLFWGTDSNRNDGKVIDWINEIPTKELAVLIAALRALKTLEQYVEYWREDRQDFCKVLVMTDSEYLVRGISQCSWGEGVDLRRAEFENEGLFRELSELMEELFEENSIPVWFWKSVQVITRRLEGFLQILLTIRTA